MKQEKEKWVTQTMESVNYREIEKIPHRLYSRLIQIPEKTNCIEKQSSTYSVLLIAASVCLLITLNIFTLEKAEQISIKKSSDYSDYFSFLESIS
jgi:hypothetical protein